MNKIDWLTSNFPHDIKEVLDIGGMGEDGSYIGYYDTKIVDILEGADIKQDLNKNPKLGFESNSFDLVVLSQILEHLCDPLPVLAEAKRVSKKYILVGLPNELRYDLRLRNFFEAVKFDFDEFGHKHRVDIDSSLSFIRTHCGDMEVIWEKHWFCSMGERFLPFKLQLELAQIYPEIFCGEIYFLLKKRQY
jgi:SAM-dependent methyltransferase